MKRWYTLHTKPNAEYQVATALQRQELEIYLPEIEENPKSSKEGKRKPFFPCYLFLKIDFASVGLSQVQWIPGLRRVLTLEDRPVSISSEVIDLIRYKLGEIESKGAWLTHTFKPGDRVRIAKGPFRNMVALFEGPTTPSQRVRVLLDILGHANRVQVDVSNLEKASSSPKSSKPKRPRRTRGQGRRIKRLVEQM